MEQKALIFGDIETGVTEKKRDLNRLKLYAALASLETLESLDKKARTSLLAALRLTGFKFIRVVDRQEQWNILVHSHPLIRATVTDLLDGKKVSLQPLAERERMQVEVTPSYRLQELRGNETLRETLLIELYLILKRPTFLFRRCLWCKTNVFVQKGKQKYCSQTCGRKAAEAARKDNPKRQADVKRNMKRYLERKAAQKAAQ